MSGNTLYVVLGTDEVGAKVLKSSAQKSDYERWRKEYAFLPAITCFPVSVDALFAARIPD